MTVHLTPGEGSPPETATSPLHRDRLTRRERGVWRAALVLLGLLALSLAVTTWDSIRAMPLHLEALPVGLVLLVALFVAALSVYRYLTGEAQCNHRVGVSGNFSRWQASRFAANGACLETGIKSPPHA